MIRKNVQLTTWPAMGGLLLVVVALALGVAPRRPVVLHAAGITPPSVDQLAYPHVFLYGAATSGGFPYTGSETPVGTCNNNGAACAYVTDCSSTTAACTGMNWQPLDQPLNLRAIADASRFQTIILPPTPTTDNRPDIFDAFRAAGPSNIIFGYVLAALTWCPADVQGNNSYPSGTFYRDYWLAATGGDVHCNSQSNDLLWYQDGTRTDADLINVNLAKRVSDGNGGYTYPIADALAQVIFDHTEGARSFDGIFIDCACANIVWSETSTLKFDYVRAGYNKVDPNNLSGNPNAYDLNRQEFDAGWHAGQAELFAKLRQLAIAAGKPNLIITGNGCPSSPTIYGDVNGWMREGFPFQDGGTWYTNMFQNPGGYLLESTAMREPQWNYVFAPLTPPWQPYTTANSRLARFALGSASLGTGAAVTEERSVSATIYPNFRLWYDEYAVDTTTGISAGAEKRGWLGFPTSDAYQMINTNTSPDLVSNSDFETSTSGWTMSSFSPAVASMTRETTGAAVGAADIRASVTSASPTGWHASFQSTTTFSITQGTEYSVTFWAKADHARSLDVVFDKPGGGGFAGQTLPLTTTWKKYQVRLVPNTTTTGVNVRFDIANETGDVWFDDAHVQLGVTSVYRRDFNHGIVLVNPSNNPVTVTLEKPFKKIQGFVAPSVNDGSVVSSVTLAGALSQNGVGDAIFLLDVDLTPPGQVGDLRVQ